MYFFNISWSIGSTAVRSAVVVELFSWRPLDSSDWPRTDSRLVTVVSISVPFGCDRMWLFATKSASFSSAIGSTMSCSTQRTSKRWRIGSVSSTFSAKLNEESYLPPIGFAAAMTEQRAYSRRMLAPDALRFKLIIRHTCREVTIPAFETEMVCCSIAS